MGRGKLRKILLRTAFVLVGASVFAVGSFSLAKYVSSESSEGSGSVASLGIKLFELKEGSLLESVDYRQAVPGFDIPAPRISLHINSEVSYTLYLKVTEGSTIGGEHDWRTGEYARGNAIMGQDSAGKECEVISYEMADWWEYEGTSADVDYDENGISYHTKYYKYNITTDTEHNKKVSLSELSEYMFKPVTEYNYTDREGGIGTIGLLKNNALVVSQYYGVHDENPATFYLSFEAYIRQTLI